MARVVLSRPSSWQLCLAAQSTKPHPWISGETVKLPIYRRIENNSPGEWKEINDPTGTNTTYASLIGIPTVGLPSEGLSQFNIKGRQFDLTCSSNRQLSNSEAGFGSKATNTWKLSPLNPSKACGNSTECTAPDCSSYPCPILSKSISQWPSGQTDPEFSVASCDIFFNYFEAGVSCNGSTCAVYKMRKLNLLDDGYAAGADAFTRRNYIGNTMGVLTTLDNIGVGSASARGSTNMEKWMFNPTNFIGTKYHYVQLYNLSPAEFSDRLTIVFNTFWQSTYGTTGLGGNLPNDLMQTGLLVTAVGSNITFNGTQASLSLKTPAVYRTDWKWFTALLVCSIVLLAASYIGLVLKYITLAPDIIGYASSLTLLNPYVPTPTGGTTLHGLERAALLHDLPIRIGDVCAEEQVGAIAFAKADTGRVARLSRRRFYI